MMNGMKWIAAVAALGCVAPTVLMAAPSAACQANGKAAFKAWTHGQYDKVGAHFAPDVASQLTPAKLKEVWGKVQSSAGAFQSLGAFEPRKIQGHEAMAAPMKFKNAPLAAVFACDSSDRINSFSVLNPAMVPDLKSMVSSGAK